MKNSFKRAALTLGSSVFLATLMLFSISLTSV